MTYPRMIYPITVEKISMEHHGGTKFYTLYMLSNASGHHVLLMRFGPVKKLGQFKVETFTSRAEAMKAHDKKYREKSREYRQNDTAGETCANVDELRRFLTPPVFAKMGAAAIHHLDPNAKTAGMKDDAEHATRDENGNWVGGAAPKKVDVSAQLAAQAEEERLRSQEVLSSNPNFARF